MKLIFLLSVIFAEQGPTFSISDLTKARIIKAYTKNALIMGFEYSAFGNRVLPAHAYKQVPEIRPHLPNAKFFTKIGDKIITLCLDGETELSIASYIKYKVHSDSKEPQFKFYMIIAWPRQESSEFSLLRIYKHKTKNGKKYYTRSALDKILLREAYTGNFVPMLRIFEHYKKNNDWILEECTNAKRTTGTDMLKNYEFSFCAMYSYPIIHYNVVVLNEAERLLVSGILYCSAKLEGNKLYLTYVLADAIRKWVLVKEGSLARNFLIDDKPFTVREWHIDDQDENLLPI